MAEKLPPQPSPGYVGMLILICGVMLVGILVMALELSEYGWEPKPPQTQAIALPKGNVALDVVTPAVAEAKPLEEKKPAAVAEAKPEAKPTAVAKTVPPVVEPKLPDVPPAAVVKTEPKPPVTGPTPSPLNFNRPKATTPTAETPKPADEPKSEQPKSDKPTPSPLRIVR